MVLSAVVAVTVQVPAVVPAVTAPALATVQALGVLVLKLIAKPELADPVHDPAVFTESEAGQLMVTVWLAGFTTKVTDAVALL